MRTSDWSIRSKIIALLLIPLVSLVALWLVATAATISPAVNLRNAETVASSAGVPTQKLVTALQAERRLSTIAIGRGRVDQALTDQRAATDEAVTAFRTFAGGEDVADAAGAWGRQRITEMRADLDRLGALRRNVDAETVSRHNVITDYTAIIDSGHRLLAAFVGLQDPDLAREARTVVALGRARDVLAQEDALLVGISAAGGRLSDDDPGRFSQLVGTRRALFAEAVVELPGDQHVAYRKLASGIAFTELQRFEDALVRRQAGERLAVSQSRWQPVYDSVAAQVTQFEAQRADEIASRITSQTNGLLVRLGLIGLTGLVAVIVSIGLTVIWGRAVIRQLAGLRQAALDLTGRLPEVVAKLRRGEPVDDVVEAPALLHRGDEIGAVARALHESQRATVAAAAAEARLREGFHEVFLNIARRNQALLHRQFTVLDRMERRTVEVDELEDLFRIDHLATRMRRNAENLVILAGAAPGRGWRDPVPMVDVVRGAVSEIEDYVRVNLQRIPDAALAGHAVADVIHLLAELLENATAFSPPHTQVTVAGDMVASGFAVEIEDRGLGMAPELFAEANRKLAEPPDFDPATSERLGIFVVSLLAARHGVKVSLRPSPYGGTTAIALLPMELVMPEAAQPALPAAPVRAAAEVASEPTATTTEWEAVRTADDLAPVLTISAVDATDGTRTGEPDATKPRVSEPAATEPVATEPAVTEQPGAVATEQQPGPAVTEQPAPGGAAPDLWVEASADQQQPDTAPTPTAAGLPRRPDQGPPRTTQRPRPGPSPRTSERAALPRRRRQSNLAPQLTEPQPEEPVRTEPAERSPEEVRNLMSSFQSGLTRGREEAGASDEDLSFPDGWFSSGSVSSGSVSNGSVSGGSVPVDSVPSQDDGRDGAGDGDGDGDDDDKHPQGRPEGDR